MSHSQHKKILFCIFGGLLAIGAVYLIFLSYTQPKVPPVTPVSVPPAGPIIVKGTMVCLPHIDTSGPQTLECALGLQDYEGRYFALRDTDPQYKNVSGMNTNAPVEVTGTFTPETNDRYQGVGVIEVTSIVLADVPQRATLTGKYVCLLHKDPSTPQTKECRAGILTEGGLYYALDFALSSQTAPMLKSGDMFTASGVIVKLELLSTDMWDKYDIQGIFSVTDFGVRQ